MSSRSFSRANSSTSRNSTSVGMSASGLETLVGRGLIGEPPKHGERLESLLGVKILVHVDGRHRLSSFHGTDITVVAGGGLFGRNVLADTVAHGEGGGRGCSRGCSEGSASEPGRHTVYVDGLDPGSLRASHARWARLSDASRQLPGARHASMLRCRTNVALAEGSPVFSLGDIDAEKAS